MEWFKKLKTWQKALLILFTIGVIGNIFSGKNDKNLDSKTNAEASALVDNAAVDNKIEEKIAQGNWSYSEDVDKMTNKTTKFAIIEATEKLNFDFPYQGGATASIQIRQKGKIEIMFMVDKGQIISRYDGGSVKIKIDDLPAKTYSTSNPSDGSADIIFINNANRLLAELKNAKKMIIEVEFYQAGNRQIEFETQGLKF
jgi:hypothetical protein